MSPSSDKFLTGCFWMIIYAPLFPPYAIQAVCCRVISSLPEKIGILSLGSLELYLLPVPGDTGICRLVHSTDQSYSAGSLSTPRYLMHWRCRAAQHFLDPDNISATKDIAYIQVNLSLL